MSIGLNTRRRTATQRVTDATQQVAELLQLDDLKALTAALVEVAAEGVRRNPSFAAQVRRVYEETTAEPKPSRGGSRARLAEVELVPIKSMPGYEVIPGGAPDPYFLHELYGAGQLPLALGRYTLSDLQLAAESVQWRNPGTKPKNKARRADVIDYIVRYVTGQVHAE